MNLRVSYEEIELFAYSGVSFDLVCYVCCILFLISSLLNFQWLLNLRFRVKIYGGSSVAIIKEGHVPYSYNVPMMNQASLKSGEFNSNNGE